ncbi:globin domain-containing protein [Actinomadura hibisca]|uniref:globin domain-containing protein n=1 Tax=Actinomadura hibisca TaxID=68565 RepID=UPI0009FDF8FF|nr:globin domain-containing protein [Actinomadura hibisca]
MSLEPRIVKESFIRIEPEGEKAAAYFYGRLFAENPRLRALFPPAMDLQRDRLFHALTKIVWSLDSPESLAGYLGQLGRDHRKFGVLPEHYPAVGAALIATLRRFAGPEWTAEAEAAWTAAYQRAADLMMGAAEQDAAHSPPWWVAEVVAHERRSPDLALLTLRPDRPLPFTAGQYLTVQTARWPRVWRPYSIANAPRSDGLLRLHVRAVPGGWVSGALVRHTAAGDTLLLGPALGSAGLAPDSDRDLLLVAGGTGLAPMKALVEQVLLAGHRRNVRLLVGARTERDLYDLPDLRLLESSYPWLRVVPVVSEDSDFDGMRGTLPDAVGRLGGWEDHEVHVCGPAEMIRRTVGELQRLGVPLDRVHHDLLEAEGIAPHLAGACPVHSAAPVPALAAGERASHPASGG